MQNNNILVLILILSVCCVSASQSFAPPASNPPKESDYKLKSVELDGKYTIQVPNYFTVGRVDAAGEKKAQACAKGDFTSTIESA
jgi:hypothetical protein